MCDKHCVSVYIGTYCCHALPDWLIHYRCAYMLTVIKHCVGVLNTAKTFMLGFSCNLCYSDVKCQITF